MIEAKGIVKSFYDIKALQGVSMSVKKGSIYGLLGSNGAGKTTLLKLLAGIYRPDAGQVAIDGKPVLENTVLKGKMAFIPDQLYYFPNYTINEMAVFYRSIYSRWNEEKFLELGQIFAIEKERKIRTLSKGMQRQVAFWLSLSWEPEVMLLDEPLDGLDPVMRKKVKKLLIGEVAEREMTVVISSHNLRELEDMCDYVGILHNGRMLLQKELDEYRSNIHKVQLAFNRDIPTELFAPDNGECIERRGSVLVFISRGAKEEVLRRFKSYDPAILDILPLTLEEVFIYEMGGEGYAVRQLFE